MHRGPASVATDWLDRAEACLKENNPWGAKRLLSTAREPVQQALRGWQNKAIGVCYRCLVDECRAALSKPCGCIYCGLTDEQKLNVKEKLERKFAKFNHDFDSNDARENNFIAAYGESVLAAYSGLPINEEAGGDGGIDFRFPDGMTVDVKATRYGQLPLLKEDFIKKAGHVFVYIQVVNGDDESFRHAFFLGFAPSDGDFKLVKKKSAYDRPEGWAPRTPGNFEEFNKIIQGAL